MVAEAQSPLRASLRPTSSNWMNLVERWFGHLDNKAIRRGVFLRIADLQASIEAFSRLGIRIPNSSCGPRPSNHPGETLVAANLGTDQTWLHQPHVQHEEDDLSSYFEDITLAALSQHLRPIF